MIISDFKSNIKNTTEAQKLNPEELAKFVELFTTHPGALSEDQRNRLREISSKIDTQKIHDQFDQMQALNNFEANSYLNITHINPFKVYYYGVSAGDGLKLPDEMVTEELIKICRFHSRRKKGKYTNPIAVWAHIAADLEKKIVLKFELTSTMQDFKEEDEEE